MSVGVLVCAGAAITFDAKADFNAIPFSLPILVKPFVGFTVEQHKI